MGSLDVCAVSLIISNTQMIDGLKEERDKQELHSEKHRMSTLAMEEHLSSNSRMK